MMQPGPPWGPPVRLKFSQALWPVTVGAILLGLVLAGIGGWMQSEGAESGRSAAYDSGYRFGYVFGGMFVAILLPLGGAWVAYLFSRSSRTAPSMVGLLLAGVMILGGAGRIGLAVRGSNSNEQVLREMAGELEGFKEEYRDAIQSGDAEAANRLDEKSLGLLKKYRQEIKGPLAEYLDRLIDFREQVTEVSLAYDVALKPILGEGFFDTTELTRSELAARIELVERWSVANRALLDVFDKYQQLELDQKKLRRKGERDFVRGLTDSLGRTGEVVRAVRAEDDILARLVLEVFELYAQEWGRVQGGASIDLWAFEEPDVDRRREQIVDEIEAAAARQEEAQLRLVE